jgi:(1->4)-alpha-D-glucan 1-alpha-D-glucosylmutase
MVAAFVKPLVEPGRVNSLSQALVKLIAPGVPDIYQGTELWDLSLVDPDNRRPVDYQLRRRLLEELEGLSAEQIMARSDEGLPKQWLTRQALRLRRQHPEWFGAESTYEGLVATGPQSDHVLALVRGGHVAAIVPRLVLGFDGWQNTTLKLPNGTWKNELTLEKVSGGEVAIADLLKKFPVALLHRTS